MARSLWVVVPALNEAENLVVVIPQIVAELERLDVDPHVLVVDDGSTDDTSTVVAQVAQKHPVVELQSLGRNLGKAAALRRGFGYAGDRDASVIVMMDADGQDDPSELGKLLAKLDEGYGLVTGARTVRNDRFIKRNTSKLYNGATAMLSGVPGKDFNSGFKMMRADVAQQASPMLYGELHRYLTVVAHWLGFKTTEVSVQHHERLHGKSKYGIARFWRGFVDLITIRFLMNYESRPSHLFSGIGVPALGLGLLGLAYLFVDKITGHAIGGRPLLIASVVLVLGGLQLVLFGLLAELVVFSRNRQPNQR